MQKTLVIIKPDAVQRRLIGKIINRFEEKGLEIVGLKMTVISEGLAKEHYSVHEGREYYENLKIHDFRACGDVSIKRNECNRSYSKTHGFYIRIRGRSRNNKR